MNITLYSIADQANQAIISSQGAELGRVVAEMATEVMSVTKGTDPVNIDLAGRQVIIEVDGVILDGRATVDGRKANLTREGNSPQVSLDDEVIMNIDGFYEAGTGSIYGDWPVVAGEDLVYQVNNGWITGQSTVAGTTSSQGLTAKVFGAGVGAMSLFGVTDALNNSNSDDEPLVPETPAAEDAALAKISAWADDSSAHG